MRRASVLAALGLALLAAAPASAATHRWRVTAVLTGSYANDMTATARCAAHFQERISGVRFTLRSGVIDYDPTVGVLTGRLRWTLRGTWHVTGSYNASAAQADGAPGCAAQATPVDCGAAIVTDDGHRTATHGTGRLAVDDDTRRSVGVRLDVPRLTERYADAGTPPSGWPSVCRVDTPDDSVVVTPFFGFATTAIADRAVAPRLLISRHRLAGHRRFTVRGRVARPNGCPADGFDPCIEHGSFRVRLTLRPAR